jgi:hypothetical protein
MAQDEVPAGVSDERFDAGQRLLAAADELGLEAQGAAWIYMDDLEEWRYFLVTALVDTEGPLWVYKRLLRAFNKLAERDDFLSVDVQLASPNEVWFRAIMIMMNIVGLSSARDLGVDDSQVYADGRVYIIKHFRACVYRMAPAPPADSVRRIRNKFNSKTSRVLATA